MFKKLFFLSFLKILLFLGGFFCYYCFYILIIKEKSQLFKSFCLFHDIKIINFDDVTGENRKEHNQNWIQRPNHPYRILINGGS